MPSDLPRVTVGHNERESLAVLIATRPGHQAWLIDRTHLGGRRTAGRKGFIEADYARFLDAAHRQLIPRQPRDAGADRRPLLAEC